MSSAGVRFGRTTCGGCEFDTFTRLLGRTLGLLIDQLIDYDAIQMRGAIQMQMQIQPIRNVALGTPA